VKVGKRSLNSVLEEISPQKEKPFSRLGSIKSGQEFQELDGNTKYQTQRLEPAVSAKATRVHEPTDKETAPSPAAIGKALTRIKAVLGRSFHAEVNARILIKTPEEIVQFGKLSDVQIQQVGSLLKKGWMFDAAFREVVERLTPDNEIRALHTRTIENGGAWCLVTIGDFGHAVVRGNGKDKVLAKLQDFLAKSSA
jgi:hypothetical protein